MKSQTPTRWFWVATASNVVATILLLILIYSALLMLGLFTSPTSMLPFLLSPAIVLALSVIGLVLVRKQESHTARWIGYVVHLGGFLLSFSMLAYLAVLRSGIGSGKETYLIPDGYQGDVNVIYPQAQDGVHLESPTAATYRIPSDGVLISPKPEVKGWTGWTQTRYYYAFNDGMRKEITEYWDSTIPETPENLADTRNMGIFFPRTGTLSDAAGCQYRFEQFYVGSKAYLLRHYKPIDLDRYLRQHDVRCPTKK